MGRDFEPGIHMIGVSQYPEMQIVISLNLFVKKLH